MTQRTVNLFMVGAAKCGTTTIHKILSQHPDIYAGTFKEPHFFVAQELIPHAEFKKRTALTQEAYVANYAGAGNQKYLVDSSVHYLYFEASAQRIKAYNPNAKIIIVLRHPTDRIYSHYKMIRKDGETHLDFAEFLKHPIDKNGIDLVKQGFYSPGIKAFLEAFGPKQVLILNFEIVKDQDRLKAVLAEFLDVAPFPSIKAEHENSGGIPQNEFLRYLHIDFPLTRLLKWILPKSKLRAKIGSWIMSHFYKRQPMDPQSKATLDALYHDEIDILKTYGVNF